MNWIKATRSPISYRNQHLHRQDIDILNMDDVRKSLSKMKKDFKHRVGRKKRAPDRVGDNTAGERTGSSASLQQPDPRIAVSGHDGERTRTNENVLQAHSRDPSRPEPVPADAGRLNEVSPNENAECGVAANEKKSGWKSTAFATAKLLLRGVRDSADAFGPLKSVAGGLCFILENYEVRSSPGVHYQSAYTYPSE